MNGDYWRTKAFFRQLNAKNALPYVDGIQCAVMRLKPP